MIYTLSKNGLTATINTIGAELISLIKNGREYIWTGDSTYWNGHNPTLFPVIGFLKNDKTCFDGVEYSIPKHGYARKTEFSLIEIADDRITLEMRDSTTTYMGFPFHFSFQITHSLTDNGFTTTYTVINQDAKAIPFMIGGHTGFCLPFSDGMDFSDHTLVFESPENNVTRYIAINGQIIENTAGDPDYLDGSDRIALRYDLFDDDALMLTGLRSRKVALLDPNGKGVGMDFEGFDALGIWTPVGKNAPFVCIEPWNGINAMADEDSEFINKPFIRKVDVGNSYTVSYSVQIID